MIQSVSDLVIDPFNFYAWAWPDMVITEPQARITESLRDNHTTVVPAGNDQGKDFIAARLCLWFFCSRSPAKVVTHSVDQPQLKGVLWGEMKRAIEESVVKLPLHVREDMHMNFVRVDGSYDPLSYLIGRVTRKGEGLLGHHIALGDDGVPRCMFLADEASGVDNEAWEKVDTWAHRKLAIGNPYPTTNFFYKAVTKQKDIKAPTNGHYLQKIIHIDADDSPHVARCKELISRGKEPDAKILVPGILSYNEYERRKLVWDEMRQTIGLHGRFYEGREVKLFPGDWLDRAEEIADKLPGHRTGDAMGTDPAEGRDNTVWEVVDDLGLIYMEQHKTDDTNDIPGITKAVGLRYGVKPDRWVFDRGGGGKQHADRLRAEGFNCSSIGFGEAVTDPQAWKRTANYLPKKEVRQAMEERYVFKNRRAQLYGTLRLALDPSVLEKGFGLPREIMNRPRTDGGPTLREQLEILPLLYDPEGRLFLPPKQKRNTEDKTITIKDMLDGYSPDEADALALAVYAMTFRPPATVRSMI